MNKRVPVDRVTCRSSGSWALKARKAGRTFTKTTFVGDDFVSPSLNHAPAGSSRLRLSFCHPTTLKLGYAHPALSDCATVRGS